MEESAEEEDDDADDDDEEWVDESNTWVQLIVTLAQAAESLAAGDEFPLEEGAAYYENVESGETLWTPPPDGIVVDTSNVAYRWWFDEPGHGGGECSSAALAPGAAAVSAATAAWVEAGELREVRPGRGVDAAEERLHPGDVGHSAISVLGPSDDGSITASSEGDGADL